MTAHAGAQSAALNMRIILASASPRRAEILTGAGIAFETRAADIDESRRTDESAADMVRRLAQGKARAAAAPLASTEENIFVIGADTVVELDGKIFGKPGSASVATEMLRALSGRTHNVITGVAVLRLPDGAMRCEHESTAVRLAALDAQQIATYVATSEPLDKAGAYAIQARGGSFVERIEGCYLNVVGLPLAGTLRLLTELGWRRNV